MKTKPNLRAARNAWRLLGRRDARSVRRMKHWLRIYGENYWPQVSFDLACHATGIDRSQWDPESR